MQLEPIRASNMKVCHTLICVVFLSLWDGNTACLGGDPIAYTRTEGGNIRASCHFDFSLSGRHKIFCKGECEEKDILIETYEDRAQRGRYSIEYEHLNPVPSIISMDVSISNLTKSDSGWYKCKVDRSTDSFQRFELRVEDAPTASKPNRKPTTKAPFTPSVPSASTPTTTQSLSSSSGSSTPSSSSPETPNQPEQTPAGPETVNRLWGRGKAGHPPFTPSVPSASTPTTTQSLSSSSGSSTPSSSSPETTNQPEQQQTPAGPGQVSLRVLLYVSLTLVMLIIASAAVLIFCRKRASKPKEPHLETEYANVTEANRVFEEIREDDRQSRSPPAEISTVYTYAKYSKPNAVETTDECSLITAAGPQNKTEDDPSKLTYSEVDFPNSATASPNSAPSGDADNVIYSVPQSEASSDGSRTLDASPPLYSTVSLHQL